MYVAWIFFLLYFIPLHLDLPIYSVTVRFYKLQIPIKIWLKIFDSVTLPIVLYGSDILRSIQSLELYPLSWGMKTQQNFYMQTSAATFYSLLILADTHW